jgi:hypothetical protein
MPLRARIFGEWPGQRLLGLALAEATCGNYGGDPDSPGDDDDVRVSLFLVLLTLTEVLAPDHVEG